MPGGLPGGSAGKESACDVGDLASIPGSRRSSREGSGYHSSIPAWRIPWKEGQVDSVTESDMTEELTPWASLVVQTVKNLPAVAAVRTSVLEGKSQAMTWI